MDGDLSRSQIGLLLLVHRLISREQPLGRDTILPYAEVKLPQVAENYESLCRDLLEMGYFQGTPENFDLTPEGLKIVKQSGNDHSLVAMFYDEYYRSVELSQAHSRFCEQVYGKDLAQHGTADLEQLDILVNEIGLQSGDSFLDFGCGSGRITEYLSDATSTRAAGIDKSPEAIRLAQQRTAAKADRLAFYWANIHKNQGQLPNGSYDHVIAIDSLFFAPDQKLVLETLLKLLKPGGLMGIFYLDFQDQSPAGTPLGMILEELGLDYSTRDLSSLNKAHWIKKKKVLQEMEREFLEEGSSFLFKNRLAECDSGMEDLKRYLYIITGNNHA